MKKRKLIIALSIALSVLIIGVVVVYAAAYNSESDPLVALSYLTSVFKPSIDNQISAVSNRLTSAEKKLAELEGSVGSGDFDTTEIDSRLDSLENTDGTHSEEISSVKTQIAEAKTSLSEIRASLEQLSEDSANKSDVSSLSERLDVLSSQLDGQSEEIDTLIGTYEKLIEKLVDERIPSENNYGYETVVLSAGQSVNCIGKCSVMLRSGSGTYSFTDGGYDSTAMTDILSGSEAELEHIVIFDGGVQFTASESSAVMIKGEYTVE